MEAAGAGAFTFVCPTGVREGDNFGRSKEKGKDANHGTK